MSLQDRQAQFASDQQKLTKSQLSLAQTVLEKQLNEESLQNPPENKPVQRSIFGKIVVDRQKKREGDALSDEAEDVKPLIYEEEKEFDTNAYLHRPQLMQSFVNDYFGNPVPTKFKDELDEFGATNDFLNTEFTGLERRNTQTYESRTESDGSKEVVRRVSSPQAPPRKTNSIKLEESSQSSKSQKKQRDSEPLNPANQSIEVEVQRSSSQILDPMYEDLMKRPIASQYKKLKKDQPFQAKVDDNVVKEEDSNSSQSYLSDNSFDAKNYIQADDSESVLKQQIKTSNQQTTGIAGIGSVFLDQILKPKRDTDIDDILQVVNISEYSYQSYAQRKLQDSKAISIQTAKLLTQQQRQTQLVVQRVMAGPKTMKDLTQQFAKRQNEGIKSTCIALSEFSVIIGTSAGLVFIYDKDTEKPYSVYREESKDFKDNAVTCIDVHPLRHEYVVTGHLRGQLVLLDLTKLPQESQSNVKCIKDHHSSPVVSVKFCDWLKERPINQDKPAWMIVSSDMDGNIIITRISSVAFRILTTDKMFVINSKAPMQVRPKPNNGGIQYSLAAKFHNPQYPQSEVNDSVTLIAVGSPDEVSVEVVLKERSQRIQLFKRPKHYLSENQKKLVQFSSQLPCLSWGYGKTPCFKDQTYCILAIAWGPLVQLLCIKDLNAKQGEDVFIDGSYLIASSTMYKHVTNGDVVDSFVQSINFVDESLLLVTLSNQDIRVLYTKNFYPGAFQSVQVVEEELNFDRFDSRIKLSQIGAPLTKEQQEIELERRTYLEYPIQKSAFGLPCSQTIVTCNGRAVILSAAGIFKLIHLTWEQSLGNIEPQILNGNSWIDIFAKTLEIYLGKVKGLRGVPDDDNLRQLMMKGQMKVKIGDILEIVISSWKKLSAQAIEQRIKTKEQARTELNRNLQTLMRIIIELTVEIQESDYLFTDVYQRFKDEDCGEMFANEIKAYILNGLFSDWDAPEEVLNFHVLQYHQQIFQEAFYGQNTSPTSGLLDQRQVSPAENFEKIMINLSFKTCSRMNIQEMIEFCKKYRLSTGAFYLYVSTQGDQGPVQGLNTLRDFYLEALKEEAHKNNSGPRIGINEVKQLINIAANSAERLPLERSSTYQGLKLLWATRLLVEGKRFPKGKLEKPEWQKACQSVLLHITQGDFIKTMCDIDAGAFFQILSIPFHSTQIQHSFLLKGQPVTHQTLIQNTSTYCLMLPKNDSVRVSFLCFIASIGNSDLIKQDRLFFHNTTLELLQNSDQLIAFNNELLQRQTHTKLCKMLSQRAQQAAPEMRAHILSEDQLMQLIRKSEQLTQENILELVSALADTTFETLKILIYEKQEDYSKCLQLQLDFMRKNHQVESEDHKLHDCFTWIIKVHFMLERRVKDWDETSNNRQTFQSFQREVLRYTDQLTQIDPHKTVGLCDAIFKSDHEQMINIMQISPSSQYAYVSKLLELKHKQIQQCVQAYNQYKQIEFSAQAQSWTKILAMHVRLTSKLHPERLVDLIKKIGKQNYYPVEECLRICTAADNLEASALLCLEVGNYQESILLYLKLLERQLNPKAFRKELFYLQTHRRTKRTRLPCVELFEGVISQLKVIIGEHPEEVLRQTDVCWQKILETVSSLSLNTSLMRKQYCKRYLSEVLQQFCRQLLQFVSFNHIVDSYLKTQPMIRYREMFTVIKEVFANTCSTKLQSAVTNNLTLLDCKDLEDSFLQEKTEGILCKQVICGLCDERVHQSREHVYLFECRRYSFNHTFHQNCLKNWAKDERKKNKKASLKEDDLLGLRCPVCNFKNWDISGPQVQKTYKIQQQRNEELLQGNLQANEAVSVQSDNTKKSSHSESSGNSSGTFQIHLPTPAQKKVDLLERRLIEKQKKMKAFDLDVENSMLNIENFRLGRQI